MRRNTEACAAMRSARGEEEEDGKKNTDSKHLPETIKCIIIIFHFECVDCWPMKYSNLPKAE